MTDPLSRRGAEEEREARSPHRKAGRDAGRDDIRDELARTAWELARRWFFSEELHARLGDAATAAGVPHAGSLKALVGLDAERPQSMRSLASTMGCDASYVTSLVDTLERLGYVERRGCPGDRRVKLVQVTAKGRGAQARAAAVITAPPEALARLDESELHQLTSLLAKLLADHA